MSASSDMTAKAEQVLDLMCCNVPEAGDVRQASIADIAAALSEAREQGAKEERERCTELLRVITETFERCDIANQWTGLLATLRDSIEAGRP